MMLQRNRAILGIAIVAALALGLAACGGGSNSSGTSSSTSPGGGATVATKSISGTGTVLVDSTGAALYTNNMDSAGKIVCDMGCTAIWVPLKAPAGGPTAADTSTGSKLGTVKRPDGSTQVTYGGKPLYTFVEDGPGQVTGDGASDQFGGTHFTWTVARGSGSGTAAAPATTTQSSGGGMGGY